MGTRQYIGARYVPKFADPIAWDDARSYEALEIVTYMNTSYTSKKPVPVGTAITNSEYWVATGNYNAQVEAYRQEVEQYKEDVEGLGEGFKSVAAYGAVGDGTTDDTEALAACVADCVEEGCGLLIPADMNIKVSNYTEVAEVRKIRCYGEITAPNGIEFTVDARENGLDWYIYSVTGKLIMSGMKRGFVSVVHADELELWADSDVPTKYGIGYVTFDFGDIPVFTMKGYHNGWINENIFFGGRFVTFTIEDTGAYPHNHNQWFNPCLEGATVNVKIGRNNIWHNARLEDIVSVTFGSEAVSNYFEAGYEGTGTHYMQSYPWWHDDYGRNYLYHVGESAVKHISKSYTPTSYNYSGADKLYPSNGKLHNTNYNSDFFASDFIAIDKVINIRIRSDVAFCRGRIDCYDANHNLITTEPSASPIRGVGVTWDNTNHWYQIGSSNWGAANLEICRFNPMTGEDSGVRYIKIIVNGYANADFNYWNIDLTTWMYNENVLKPFGCDRISAATAPANTVTYSVQVFIFNTNMSNAILGWWNKNGTWTAIN